MFHCSLSFSFSLDLFCCDAVWPSPSYLVDILHWALFRPWRRRRKISKQISLFILFRHPFHSPSSYSVWEEEEEDGTRAGCPLVVGVARRKKPSPQFSDAVFPPPFPLLLLLPSGPKARPPPPPPPPPPLISPLFLSR